MRLLLDTQVLVWTANEKLPKDARKLVLDAKNTLFFSSASIWELAIKKSLSRKDFRLDVDLLYRGLLDNHYFEIPVTSLHSLIAAGLPMLHKDPFDRILLAQAKSEGLTFLTSDLLLTKYPAPTIFCKT
jgi:PIN domain nuclease of toxin-antitoxin system